MRLTDSAQDLCFVLEQINRSDSKHIVELPFLWEHFTQFTLEISWKIKKFFLGRDFPAIEVLSNCYITKSRYRFNAIYFGGGWCLHFRADHFYCYCYCCVVIVIINTLFQNCSTNQPPTVCVCLCDKPFELVFVIEGMSSIALSI